MCWSAVPRSSSPEEDTLSPTETCTSLVVQPATAKCQFLPLCTRHCLHRCQLASSPLQRGRHIHCYLVALSPLLGVRCRPTSKIVRHVWPDGVVMETGGHVTHQLQSPYTVLLPHVSHVFLLPSAPSLADGSHLAARPGLATADHDAAQREPEPRHKDSTGAQASQ